MMLLIRTFPGSVSFPLLLIGLWQTLIYLLVFICGHHAVVAAESISIISKRSASNHAMINGGVNVPAENFHEHFVSKSIKEEEELSASKIDDSDFPVEELNSFEMDFLGNHQSKSKRRLIRNLHEYSADDSDSSSSSSTTEEPPPGGQPYTDDFSEQSQSDVDDTVREPSTNDSAPENNDDVSTVDPSAAESPSDEVPAAESSNGDDSNGELQNESANTPENDQVIAASESTTTIDTFQNDPEPERAGNEYESTSTTEESPTEPEPNSADISESAPNGDDIPSTESTTTSSSGTSESTTPQSELLTFATDLPAGTVDTFTVDSESISVFPLKQDNETTQGNGGEAFKIIIQRSNDISNGTKSQVIVERHPTAGGINGNGSNDDGVILDGKHLLLSASYSKGVGSGTGGVYNQQNNVNYNHHTIINNYYNGGHNGSSSGGNGGKDHFVSFSDIPPGDPSPDECLTGFEPACNISFWNEKDPDSTESQSRAPVEIPPEPCSGFDPDCKVNFWEEKDDEEEDAATISEADEGETTTESSTMDEGQPQTSRQQYQTYEVQSVAAILKEEYSGGGGKGNVSSPRSEQQEYSTTNEDNNRESPVPSTYEVESVATILNQEYRSDDGTPGDDNSNDGGGKPKKTQSQSGRSLKKPMKSLNADNDSDNENEVTTPEPEVSSTCPPCDELREQLTNKTLELEELNIRLMEMKLELREKDLRIQEKDKLLQQKDLQVQQKDLQLQEKDLQLRQRKLRLRQNKFSRRHNRNRIPRPRQNKTMSYNN